MNLINNKNIVKRLNCREIVYERNGIIKKIEFYDKKKYCVNRIL